MKKYLTFFLGLGIAIQTISAQVTPNPLSRLKDKKVLVLDGNSGSHSSARSAASNGLRQIDAAVNPETDILTFASVGQVNAAFLNDFDIVVFNFFFQTEQMSPTFKSAIQNWLASGNRGYVGYHTSGANQDGEWDWYRENVTSMLYILHSSSAQEGTVFRTEDAEILENPIMEGLPETFTGIDEWYEFDYGVTWSDCKVMYFLDESSLSNPLERPMDPHPMGWYREDPETKSRYFYTPMIHTPSGVNTSFFLGLMLRGLEYVAGYEIPGCPDSTYEEYNPDRTVDDSSLCLTPVGVNMVLQDAGSQWMMENGEIRFQIAQEGSFKGVIRSISGKVMTNFEVKGNSLQRLSTNHLEAGLYVLQVITPSKVLEGKILLR